VLTAAGKAFLDHARLALAQVEAAREAARRAAHPEKPTFALGFLTGQEMDWLPEAMHILRDALPPIDVTVTDDRLIVALADGRELSAPLAWFPRLSDATAEQRGKWRLIRRGHGIHWPQVDEDISIASLLRAA